MDEKHWDFFATYNPDPPSRFMDDCPDESTLEKYRDLLGLDAQSTGASQYRQLFKLSRGIAWLFDDLFKREMSASSSGSYQAITWLLESHLVWIRAYLEAAKRMGLPEEAVLAILRHICELSFQLSIAMMNSQHGDPDFKKGMERVLRDTTHCLLPTPETAEQHTQEESHRRRKREDRNRRCLKMSGALHAGYKKLKSLAGRKKTEGERLKQLIENYRKTWREITIGETPSIVNLNYDNRDLHILRILDYLTRVWEIGLSPQMLPASHIKNWVSPLMDDAIDHLWGPDGGPQRVADEVAYFSIGTDPRLRDELLDGSRFETHEGFIKYIDSAPSVQQCFIEVSPDRDMDVLLIDGMPAGPLCLKFHYEPEARFTLEAGKSYLLPVTGPGAWVSTICSRSHEPALEDWSEAARDWVEMESHLEEMEEDFARPIWHDW